ncbi:MAG: hypothetical protein SFU86_23150 [Pirellulaceae bacterium]|nr:hypothetical protein [Pirellulaceae bacterium]
MINAVKAMAVLVVGCAFSLAVHAAEKPTGGTEKQVQEARGIDLGGPTTIVFVARDKVTWDAVKKAAGKPQMLPLGMPPGDDLESLDNVDFQKKMIVAVFWGEMTFAGRGEQCWIESVTTGKEEVVVDCRATLWGGRTTAAYRAWPYHAKVVDRSELAVRFTQTTEWKATPDRSEKVKVLATIKAGEWKQEKPAEK